ncbi:TetR/AcrR family transcriptional regulator [Aquihabitans sp. McL0605]|uniref:TetR/AcrR family transcriptional regulator n=1 Tax=Aquihabitans sp. McL0605 TaxID=3415671 RepID=UPI003CE7EE90
MPSTDRSTRPPGSLSRPQARSSGRILDAARSLITSEGLGDLSMRRLADEADVSVRTIYNIFGDKQAVVAAVVQQSFDAMDAAMAVSHATDPIDRIWETVAISIEAYCRSVPPALVVAVITDPALNARIAPRWRGRDRILDAIATAVHDRVLRPDVGPDRLVDQAGPVHAHRLAQWAWGQIDEDELRCSVLYAYDLCLLAVAMPRTRDRLIEHMATLEPTLPALIAATT